MTAPMDAKEIIARAQAKIDEARDNPVREGGSAKVSGKEIGLEGWEIAGWREHGAVYGKAVAFARQEMGKALTRGVDDVTHDYKPADPMAALPRLVYDLFTIAIEGLPTIAEMPPLVEWPWAVKRPLTRDEMLVDLLHTFLMETDRARESVNGVGMAAIPGYGIHTWSSDAMTRAEKRIKEVMT